MRRRRFAPSSTSAYELTERGRGLEPVLAAMSRWGAGLPLSDTTNSALGVDALVVTMMSRFTGGRDAVVHLHMGDEHFRLTVRDGHLRARRAEVDDADTTVVTTAATVQSLVFAERTLTDAEQAGEITITGDRAAAEDLLC